MRTKVDLDKDGLNKHPIDLSTDAWYYEEKKGLFIYWDGSLVAIIPWRKLEQSLTHYQSYKESGKR